MLLATPLKTVGQSYIDHFAMMQWGLAAAAAAAGAAVGAVAPVVAAGSALGAAMGAVAVEMATAADAAEAPDDDEVPTEFSDDEVYGQDIEAEPYRDEIEDDDEEEDRDIEPAAPKRQRTDADAENTAASEAAASVAAPWHSGPKLPQPPRNKWKWQDGRWVQAAAVAPPEARDAEAEDEEEEPPPPEWDLRWCTACGHWSYLRKNACVRSSCALRLQLVVCIFRVHFLCIIF